jgi:hypothetical protein
MAKKKDGDKDPRLSTEDWLRSFVAWDWFLAACGALIFFAVIVMLCRDSDLVCSKATALLTSIVQIV